jgi:hypothetical protein
MNIYFKAAVAGVASVERACGLSHEAGMYKQASEHEAKKDILWPKEADSDEEEQAQ